MSSSSLCPCDACPNMNTPAEIRDDPEWTSGNFEVITSDNVRFKVNDYVLFFASAVLAAAHSVPAPEESPSPRLIHFTDDIIEHSHVFRAFLEFAQTLHIPIGAGADTLANLLLFLRKWECQSLSNLLLERLRFTLPGHSLSSLHVFSIGAKIDDERLCDTALRSVDIMRSNPWLKTDSIDCVTRFDPSNWTLDFWEDSKIPPIYLFSIIQAWHRMQEKDCKGYRSPDDLADEFMKVLAETKERSA